MLILEEIKKGEGKKLEFKRELPSGEAVAKTLIAFSNTGGGKLMIGVEDDGEIIGIDTSKYLELRDKISNYISDLIAPIIIPNIYTVNYQNRVILVIEVFRGNMPPYHLRSLGIEKGTYLRIGARNKPADIFAVDELERQKRHTTFDDEINYEYDINSLNLKVLENEFNIYGIPYSIEKLKNLRFIREENKVLLPTNALIILLGLMPFQSVQCSRFKGNNMEVFIDKKEFSGTLFEQLNSIIGFLKTHLFNRAEVIDIRRRERFEIPIPLLREIVVNALIHRDYTTNRSNIKVAVYDDRIEFISPGSLPFGLTVEEIILGGRSEARNPNLANVFRYLHIMEQWGSGIQKVIDVATKIGLDTPEVSDIGSMVGVRFPRPDEERREKIFVSEMPIWTINGHITDDEGRVILNLPEAPKIESSNTAKEITSLDDLDGEGSVESSNIVKEVTSLDDLKEYSYYIPQITKILNSREIVTNQIFVKELGISQSLAAEILAELTKQCILERFGKGRATHYKLKEKII